MDEQDTFLKYTFSADFSFNFVSLLEKYMHRRTAFTLVELLTVALIIGILMAIAIPRYRQHVDHTRDKTEQIKLLMIRDAIDRYTVVNDREPPPGNTEDVFKAAIAPYLPGEFPSLEIVPADDSTPFEADGVSIASGTDTRVDATPDNAWKYNPQTGDFFININQPTAIDPARAYSDW